MSGFVYVAESANDRAKIGFSANPKERLGWLERDTGEELYVWACIPGTLEDEARCHAMWADIALGFEWFSVTDELLAWAESCQDSGTLLERGIRTGIGS